MKKIIDYGVVFALAITSCFLFVNNCQRSELYKGNTDKYKQLIRTKDSIVNLLELRNNQLLSEVRTDTVLLHEYRTVYITQRENIKQLSLDSNLAYFRHYFNDTLPKLCLINKDSLGLFRNAQVSDIRLKFFDLFYYKKTDSVKTKVISNLFMVVNNDSIIKLNLKQKFSIADSNFMAQRDLNKRLFSQNKFYKGVAIGAVTVAVLETIFLVFRR